LAKLKTIGLVHVEPTYGPTGLQLGNEFFLPYHLASTKSQNPSNLRGEPTHEPTHEPRGEPSCAHVMEVSNNQVVVEVEESAPQARTTAKSKTSGSRKTRMTEDYTLTEEQVADA